MANYTQKELVIGGTDLKDYGLTVLRASGLWDWPKMKAAGTNWLDEDYFEASGRLVDCQYDSRQLTFDCIVVGSSWGDLRSKMASINAVLHYNGCKMLICEKYSLRGYIVYLKRMIPVESKPFMLGQAVALFKLVFEEPQPFNVQFTFDERWADPDDLPRPYDASISNPMSGEATASNKQQFVTIYAGTDITTVNLQRAGYTATINITATNKLVPVVITGEIDQITAIEIDTIGQPVLIDDGLFLRNGTITL